MSRLIDAEPIRHGHWISVDEEKKFYLRKCSECHTLFAFIDRYHYCPNCGAKMDNTIINNINDDIKTSDDEIIRCKDCKYWNKHHFVDVYVCSIHNKEGQYPHLLFEMTADDFCSRGELK